MIDINSIEFRTATLKDKSQELTAELKLSARMILSPATGLRTEKEIKDIKAYVKEGLVRVLLNTIYGDIKEYMYLMQKYARSLQPDPRYMVDRELQTKIDDLEEKFTRLLS